MRCDYCGSENDDNAKRCKHCHKALMTNVDSSLKPKVPIIVLAIGLVVLCAIAFVAFFSPSMRMSPQEAYDCYRKVDEVVDKISSSHLNAGGYHEVSDVPELLGEVEAFGNEHHDLIAHVQNTGQCVEFELANGHLYLFAPLIEGMLDGGDGHSIITMEPWWTDVAGVSSLRWQHENSKNGMSGIDEAANNVARRLGEYAFSDGDNLDDDQVSVNSFERIGKNRLVLYYGHGLFSPTEGPCLSTGDCYTLEYERSHEAELANHELIHTNADDRLCVSPKFFSRSRFGKGAFDGSDFYLLACHSCQDQRLSNALVELGARTVTGYTQQVSVNYGTEMFAGVMGLEEDVKGLVDVGDDGRYLTFYESLKNAKKRFNASDEYYVEWFAEKMLEEHASPGKEQTIWHDPAECVCYPQDASKTARLTETLEVHLEREDKNVRNTESLNAQRNTNVGIANTTVAEHDGNLYCAVQSEDHKTHTSIPLLVRINPENTADSEIVWRGESGPVAGEIPNPCMIESYGEGVVALYPKVEQVAGASYGIQEGYRAYVIPYDGSSAIELGLSSDVVGFANGNPFAVYSGRVYYGTCSIVEDFAAWQVRSCSLDGSGDILVCDGTTTGLDDYPRDFMKLLGFHDDRVFFCVPKASKYNYPSAVYSAPLDGSSPATQVLDSSIGLPCLLGDRIYVVEGNSLVHYRLDGNDREVVASIKGHAEISILNMDGTHAYVCDMRADPCVVWRIDLATGGVEETGLRYPDTGYLDFSVVNGRFYSAYLSITNIDYDTGRLSTIWEWDGEDTLASNDSKEIADVDGESSYVGVYTLEFEPHSSSAWANPSYSVCVASQDGADIVFWVAYYGTNASPIYETNEIQATVVDGIAEFGWSDNWSNSGVGTLKFSDGSVNVKMTELERGSANRYSLATDDAGRDLPKVNDEVPVRNPRP